MLTVYNGTSITYDEIGNPSNWHNALSMSWDKRELTSLTLNDNGTLSFSYNSSGLRTQKVYTNGDTVTVHDYILDGTSIISETVTENGVAEYTLYYFYDETGVAGFEYNGVKYHYIKNLQGDIVSIYNNNGAVVVNYTYDAWGKVLSVTGSLASTVGQINPFRYRGYYYDTETEWYYLQSRYYDPSVGRFLNADGIVGANGGVVGYNMFAYCNNNPVMCCDPTGYGLFKDVGNWLKETIIEPVVDFAKEKIIKPTVDMVENVLSKVDIAHAQGIGVDVALGSIQFNGAFGYAADTEGNININGSLGGGLGTADAGLTVYSYESSYNVPTANDLREEAVNVGGDISIPIPIPKFPLSVYFGGDFNILPIDDEEYYGLTMKKGLTIPVNATPSVSVGGGYTWVSKSFNIFDFIREALN